MPKVTDDRLRAAVKTGLNRQQDASRERVGTATPASHAALLEVADRVMSAQPGGLATPAVTPPAPVPRIHDVGATSQTVVRLAVDLLDPNPYNARAFYNDADVQKMAVSIARQQLKPASVMPNPDRPGRYIIIDGGYRARAAKVAGKPLDVIISPVLSSIELYRQSFVHNDESVAATALDHAFAWRKLLDDKVAKDETDICAATGMSRATVNKTLALFNLPEAVLNKMIEQPHRFGIKLAFELTQIFKEAGEGPTHEIVDRMLVEDVSYREVEEFRTQHKPGTRKKRKAKDVSRPYKLKSEEGAKIGVLKEWDSNCRVALDVNCQNKAAQATLMDLLKEHFKV